MKETPIIMSGNHPKLVLDGTKTRTRRVIKPQPRLMGNQFAIKYYNSPKIGVTEEGAVPQTWLEYGCPYGQVGDRLWVRETHKFTAFGFALNAYIEYKDGEKKDVTTYIKDGTMVYNQGQPNEHKWRPSIHMPRWASRIERIISLLKVERLRDISEADAQAEGGYTIEEFITLYLKINHLPEDADPWNWVIGW